MYYILKDLIGAEVLSVCFFFLICSCTKEEHNGKYVRRIEKFRVYNLKPGLSKVPVRFERINYFSRFFEKEDIKSDLNKPRVLKDFLAQISKGELGTMLCKTLGRTCDIHVV